MKITPDACRSCGACCITTGSGADVAEYGYADLTDEDFERLSPHVRRQLHDNIIGGEVRRATKAKELPSGAYACQYLRGTPGQRCSCSIYESRPDVCRAFKVGGDICRDARRRAADDLESCSNLTRKGLL